MKVRSAFRLLAVTATSGLSVITLSGFFFFFIPLGLFLPDDKKTVTELEQKQDWQGLLNLSDKRIQDLATATSGGGNYEMYAPEKAKTKDGISPSEAPWLYIKGLAQQKMQRCTEAIPTYQRAIDANKGNYVDAKNNLGLCQITLMQFNAALQTFQSIITSNPDYWQAYFNAGLAYVAKSDVAMANQYEQQLRTKNATMADNLMNLHIKPLEMKIELENTRQAEKRKEEQQNTKTTTASADVNTSTPTETPAPAPVSAPVVALQRDATPATDKSIEMQLVELKVLFDKGLISKEVYDSKQRDILRLK